MGRAIKLVLYYFAYQLAFTFLVGLPAGIIKAMNEISGNGSLAYAAGKNVASMTGLVMVLAGIAMIWHLIYFKYVQFNKASWTEVPAKTILLSIPFIIAAMFICNVASEFIELPNLVEDTFIGMSRNIFGIIAIAVMAPLVEELLFRGAIEGHFLQTGKDPVWQSSCQHSFSVSSMSIRLKYPSPSVWDWYSDGFITAQEASYRE